MKNFKKIIHEQLKIKKQFKAHIDKKDRKD